MSSHPETAITADEHLPVIHVVRDFDYPVEAVFRAHRDPELVRQWLGPRRLTMKIDQWEPRTGGGYRYMMSGEDGTEHWFYGSFHEIREPARLVQTFTYEGFPDGVSLDTHTFTDLGGGRSRLHISSVFDSIESRDGALASGMNEGVIEGYERLDDLLNA